MSSSSKVNFHCPISLQIQTVLYKSAVGQAVPDEIGSRGLLIRFYDLLPSRNTIKPFKHSRRVQCQAQPDLQKRRSLHQRIWKEISCQHSGFGFAAVPDVPLWGGMFFEECVEFLLHLLLGCCILGVVENGV